MPHTPDHKSDVQGQGIRDFLSNPFGIRDNWRWTGDGKSEPVNTKIDNAIANMLDPGQRGAAQGGNIGQRSLLCAPVSTVT